MRPSVASTLAAFITVSTCSSAAHAQISAADAPIEVNFAAGAWMARLNGTSTLGPPGLATPLVLETQLNLDEYEPAFNAELAIVKDQYWRLGFSGFDFSTSQTGVFEGGAQFGAQFGDLALQPGDPFRASFEIRSIAAELGLWWWQPYCQGPDCPVAISAGPVVGLRWVEVDQTIASQGTTQRGGGEWIIPYAGLQLEIRVNVPEVMPVLQSFTVDAGATFGPALGGDGGVAAHLHVGFTGYFTPNIAAGFGYRLFELDVENDDYEFEGGLQGLFFSLNLRF